MEEEIGHAVVNVDGLVNSIKGKLNSISEFPPFHICLVPETIRMHNHVYYNPKIVSIGPFHRPRRKLRAMEEHKCRYLRNVLRAMEEHRSQHLHDVLDHCTSEPALEECVKKLKAIKEKARKCYSGNIKPDDEFVKMMLLDGSFIIQMLLLPDEIEENDMLIRCNRWMVPAIVHDMLLLENQLPFCVLQCLAECIGWDADTLKIQALRFFSKSLPDTFYFEQSANNETTVHKTSDEIHHLLHLVHWSLKHRSLKLAAPPITEKPFCAQVVRKVLSFPIFRCLANNKHDYKLLTDVEEAGASSITVQPQEAGASSITVQTQGAGASSNTVQTQESGASSNTVQTQEQVSTFPTATELEEAGVVFKRNEGGSFLDVTFKNGVMRLPRLQITDDTNSIFRNIIAFEQCFLESGVDFTNYCRFMDLLVNTPRDVQILKQSHIVENQLGSDEEVALLFNQLCKEIATDFPNGSVGKVCKDVNKYAETLCHKWRATLKHDYFSNPWAVISLIAAVYVIFLGSVQTYYAIF